MNDVFQRAATAAFTAMYTEGAAKSIEENGRLIVPPHLWDHAIITARAVIESLRDSDASNKNWNDAISAILDCRRGWK
jgi:DNA-binding transcriptional regulator/RsmH inhibitor MraZ